MNRKELLKVELPQLPKKRTDAIYRIPTVQYIIRAKLVQDGEMLVVAFFERKSAVNGFPLPTAVLYQTENDYITQINKGTVQSWKKTKVNHALNLTFNGQAIPLTLGDEKLILKYTNRKRKRYGYGCYEDLGNAIRGLMEFQSAILQERSEKVKEKYAAAVDKRMRSIPALPKAFHNWLIRTPLKESRYIFYRPVNKKFSECFCTHCKQTVWQDGLKPRHNQKGVCPSCHSKIRFKAISRTTRLCDEAKACMLQAIPRTNEYVLRFFHVRQNYAGENWNNPKTLVEEKARLFFMSNGEITGQYKDGWNGRTGRYGWYPTQDQIFGENIRWRIQAYIYHWVVNYWFEDTYLYPNNIHNILKKHSLSYEIKKYFYGKERNVTTYLIQCFRYPFATSLYKVGLTKLAEDLLEDGKLLEKCRLHGSLQRRMHISKDALAMAIHHNYGTNTINLLSLFDDRSPTYNDLTWMLESNIERSKLLILMAHLPVEQIRRYIGKQIINHQFSSSLRNSSLDDHIAGFWTDYLKMALELGYDITSKEVMFPSRLRDEHDKLNQLIQVKFDPQMDKKIKAVYPSLHQRYYYEDENYVLRAPRGFNEFIEEGATLLHCVCTNKYYIKHVDKKSTLIFFVRNKKEPDTPYCTLEFNPQSNTIVQLQGRRYVRVPPEVEAFAQKWLHYVAQAAPDLAAA